MSLFCELFTSWASAGFTWYFLLMDPRLSLVILTGNHSHRIKFFFSYLTFFLHLGICELSGLLQKRLSDAKVIINLCRGSYCGKLCSCRLIRRLSLSLLRRVFLLMNPISNSLLLSSSNSRQVWLCFSLDVFISIEQHFYFLWVMQYFVFWIMESIILGFLLCCFAILMLLIFHSKTFLLKNFLNTFNLSC